MIIKILSVFEQTLTHSTFVETHLIEANDFQFKNHDYNSVDEIETIAHKELAESMTIEQAGVLTDVIPKNYQKKVKSWLEGNSTYPTLSTLITPSKAYILIGCSVYAMNDQGKTIDCLNSRIFFTPVDSPTKSESNTALIGVLEADQDSKQEEGFVVEGMSALMDRLIEDEKGERNGRVKDGYWHYYAADSDDTEEKESESEIYNAVVSKLESPMKFLEEVTNDSEDIDSKFKPMSILEDFVIPTRAESKKCELNSAQLRQDAKEMGFRG